MMVKASIAPLVFIFTLIAGDVNDELRAIQAPYLQFDQSRDRAFYSCQFNVPVRCVWKHNGNIITIYDYDYTWKVGNGYNTYDCSIEARSKYPQKLSDESTGSTVECIGVRTENGPPKVASDPRDSRATRTPQRQFDQSRGRSLYRCQFNFVVRCLWIVNDANIDIVKNGYTWKTGNGSNTRDCSIEANSVNTLKLSGDRDRVECIGIGSGPRKVTIGDSIELQCPAADRKQCHWTGGTESLPENNEYSYIGERGCSIRINPIRKADLTQWNCYGGNPLNQRATYTLVEQNLTDPSSTTGKTSSKTSTTSTTPTTGAISSTIATSTTTTYSIVKIPDKGTPKVTTTRKSTPIVTTTRKSTPIVTTTRKSSPIVTTTRKGTPKVATTPKSTTNFTTTRKHTTKVETPDKGTSIVETPDKGTTIVETPETDTTYLTTNTHIIISTNDIVADYANPANNSLDPYSTNSNENQSMTLTVIVVIAVVVTCAIAFVMATVIYYLRRRKNLKDKRTAPDESKYSQISFNAKSEDILCPGSISESNYMTLSGPFAPPSQKPTSNRPPPRNINNVDQSNDAIYADVIIDHTSPTASCPVEVPPNNVDDVTYADVIIGPRSANASRPVEIPRNNVDDVMYADVIIGQRSPTASRAVPHNNVGDVTYAVVMPKRH